MVGLAWLARAPVNATYATDLLPSMLLLGVGAGLSFPSLMTLSMSGATATDSGLASGLVNTTMQVGGALGLAVLATLSTTRTGHLLASGSTHAAALTGGYHLAWVISASIAGAGLLIGLLVLQGVRLSIGTEDEGVAAEPAYSEAA